MQRVFALSDEQQTQRLGVLLARHCPWSLPAERSVFLSGGLGTGKTTLTAALFAAAGAAEPVRSPTYALLETYALGAHLGVHADLYRLEDPLELEQLGLRDYLAAGTLLAVEWPERGAGGLPIPDLWLELSIAASARRCVIRSHTEPGARWLGALPVDLAASEGV